MFISTIISDSDFKKVFLGGESRRCVPAVGAGQRPRAPPGPARPRLCPATWGAPGRSARAAALKGSLGWFFFCPASPVKTFIYLFVHRRAAAPDARRGSGAVGGAAPCPPCPQHGGQGALRGRAVRAAPLLRRGRPAGDLRPPAGGRRRRGRRGAAGRRRRRLPHLRGAVPRVRPPRRPRHPAALHLPAGRKGPGAQGLPAWPGSESPAGASRAPCVGGGGAVALGPSWLLPARPRRLPQPPRLRSQRGARGTSPCLLLGVGEQSPGAGEWAGGLRCRSVSVGLPHSLRAHVRRDGPAECGRDRLEMESAPLLRHSRIGRWNGLQVGV